MFTKPWNHWLLLCGFVVFSLVLGEQAVFACPTCQDAVAQNDPTSSGMVSGFFWSILFMLSMPVLILTGLSTYFYFLVLQARAQQAAVAAALAGRDGGVVGIAGVSSENADRKLMEMR